MKHFNLKISNDDKKKKLSSTNLLSSTKIFGNVCLSPHTNKDSEITDKAKLLNFKTLGGNFTKDNTNININSNTNMNYHTIQTESKERSNSHYKNKPQSPMNSLTKKSNSLSKNISQSTTNMGLGFTKDANATGNTFLNQNIGIKKRLLSPTTKPVHDDRILTEPSILSPVLGSNRLKLGNTNSNQSNNINNQNNHTSNSYSNLYSPKSDDNKNIETINVADLLGAQNNVPITINNLYANFPGYEAPKCSVKSLTTVKAYSANTNQGIIR
jgi:hypothetical protein